MSVGRGSSVWASVLGAVCCRVAIFYYYYSDLAERFTGPSRECMEWLCEMGPSAYDVCSCFAGCASRALESGALPLTSASSRGRQSVNPRTAVISTDRQTDALSDSIFSEVIDGTLGPKKARGDPIPT